MLGAHRRRERAPRLDLVSDAFKRDPFPTFDRLHTEGALVRARIPLVGECWLVTTHEAVSAILKDSKRFVVDARNAGRGRFDAFPFPIPKSLRLLADNMLGRDDPDHHRLRNLVERAFRRRSIESLGGRIEALAEQLIEPIAMRVEAGDTVDVLERLARPLPLAVICELLGLPERDRSRFTRWVGGLSDISSPIGVLRVLPGLRSLTRYLVEQFEHARRHGGEGLLAALVEAEEEGERLSEEELVSMVFLLLVAGHETTTHLISGGVLALLDHPRELDALRGGGEPALAPAVEELLRFVTPVQMTKPRYATEALELHGHAIARGELLMPVLAAANSDPGVFEAPHRLDPSRSPNPHLAFGTGVHSCLGLQLARAEGRAAIGHLLARLPGLRLATSPQELRWTRRLGIRALRALPLRA